MPDNGAYYVASYAACAVILGGYTIALVARIRAVRARLAEAERLEGSAL